MTTPMLTTREVAERLGYSTQTVSQKAKAGVIPGAARIFGRWRFDPDKFEAWEASQQTGDPWRAAPGARGGKP